MSLPIAFAIFLLTFFIMEAVTWATHKYVMHGFLWYFHADHHEPGYPHVFEKNDFFFLIFAIPSFLLIYFGLQSAVFPYYLAAIGLGIAAYGLAYFLVHDVLIHRRFKWFRNTQSRYLRAIRKAHKLHHKVMGKQHSAYFGLLYVPMALWRKTR